MKRTTVLLLAVLAVFVCGIVWCGYQLDNLAKMPIPNPRAESEIGALKSEYGFALTMCIAFSLGFPFVWAAWEQKGETEKE